MILESRSIQADNRVALFASKAAKVQRRKRLSYFHEQRPSYGLYLEGTFEYAYSR